MFNILQVQQGVAISRICPCASYSEKELLYNILLNSGSGLPDMGAHAGEFLTNDGNEAFWAALAGGGDVVASGTLSLNSIALGGGGTTIKTTTTGTGIVAALGVNIGLAGAPVLFNGAGGTPTSLTLTNAGGLTAAGGGTGQSTYVKGDILASPGTNLLNKLAVGTDGFVLTADAASTNGIKWAAAASGGLTNITETSAAGSVTLTANTGRTFTLATLDGNKNIILAPHGTGSVAIAKIALTGGVIDGTTIGGTTPAAGTFTAITVGVASSVTGSILLKGTTSGAVTLKTADAAGTYTLTLPTNDGGAGEFLQTDGSGVLSWAAGGGGGATLGANTFTALQTITQASANAGILASTGYSLTGSNATSMIDLAGTWNTTGAPTAVKLNITNTASDAASLLMDLQVGGVSKFSVSKAGALSVSGNISTSGTISATSGTIQGPLSTLTGFGITPGSLGTTLTTNGLIYWNAGTRIWAPSDGLLLFTDNAGTSFGRLQFGVTDNTGPALKRSSTELHCRLADDSAFAKLVFLLPTSNPGPGTIWNNLGVATVGT